MAHVFSWMKWGQIGWKIWIQPGQMRSNWPKNLNTTRPWKLRASGGVYYITHLTTSMKCITVAQGRSILVSISLMICLGVRVIFLPPKDCIVMYLYVSMGCCGAPDTICQTPAICASPKTHPVNHINWDPLWHMWR